jgi:hypothetical protein
MLFLTYWFLFFLLLFVQNTHVFAWRHYKSWSTRNWCEQIIDPLWPYAYSKSIGLQSPASAASFATTGAVTFGQGLSELKGRTASNFQNMGHECTVGGAYSRCSICENFACGDSRDETCAFQIQGIAWETLPINVPTISDTPFAVGVNVTHRNDFSNANRVCVITSSGTCLEGGGRVNNDYSTCAVRCWGDGEESPVPAPRGWMYYNQRGGLLQGRVDTFAGGGGKKVFHQASSQSQSQSSKGGYRDGPSNQALFNHPQGVAVDALGYVYVADTDNHCIRCINASGFVFTLAGKCGDKPGYLDGRGDNTLFSFPSGISVQLDCGATNSGSTPGGVSTIPYEKCNTRLIIADTANHRIRRLQCISFNVSECYGNRASRFWLVSTLAGGGNTSVDEMEKQAHGLADGKGTFARFDSPLGVASDTSGNIFVADTRNRVIRWIDRDSNVRTLVGKVIPFERQPPGCPYPCVRGVAGYLDSNLTESLLLSPVSISIGPGRPYTLLIIDADRVRLVTRRKQIPFADSKELQGQGFAQGATAFEIEQLDSVVTLSGGKIDHSSSSSSSSPSSLPRNLLIKSSDGAEDGIGEVAHFDKPRGMTMTADGRIYIADTVRCRLRSLTVGAQVARKVSCKERLVDILRPSGCTGLDAPVDLVDRMATSSFAYEAYNVNTSGFFDEGPGGGPSRPDTSNWLYSGSWFNELSAANDMTVAGDGYRGTGLDGRRIPACVGTPPPDLGFTMATPAAQRYNGTVEIPFELDEDTDHGTTFFLQCPTTCASNGAGSGSATASVIGGRIGEYGDESSLCLAAIHAGVVSDTDGGFIVITLRKGYGARAGRLSMIGSNIPLLGSTVNNITSSSTSNATRTFTIAPYALPLHSVMAQTLAGAPNAPLERGPCGYEDGEPPLNTRFNGPSGIAAFFNSSLTEAEFLYIADTDNHVIRKITAICSMTCENGGICSGPEKCSCREGWGASDCTRPICTSPCGPRKLCTAPNTCTCIPGYSGNDCLTPLCVQQCRHGSCVAPDTCSCQPGWFDPNCTTTVCAQTCGNGGNCTTRDTCTCPSMWMGNDCRTPVCHQTCLNGGFCSAPNTCTCPPQWSSFDCSKPVCHQGFFRADPYPQGYSLSEWREPSWVQFEPCDYKSWCASTDEFECYQLQRQVLELQLPEIRNISGKGFVAGLDPYMLRYSSVTGRPNRGSQLAPIGQCIPIELNTTMRVPYRLWIDSGGVTPYARFEPLTPYGWGPTSSTNQWSSAVPSPADRQVAFVSYVNITQGVYVCANGGNCTKPDTCVCAPGWVGFDCRTPICTQGYYFPNRNDSRYPGQGTYWGSPRTVTIWENPKSANGKFPGYIHDTPRFSSSAFDMDTTLGFDLTHKLFLGPGSQDPPEYLTYEGWRLFNYSIKQKNVKWLQGNFNATFNRTCDNSQQISAKKTIDLRFWIGNGSYVSGVSLYLKNTTFAIVVNGTTANSSLTRVQGQPVDDTALAFSPRIVFTDERVIAEGRWEEAGGECIDRVILGCYNRGVCALPNQCECSFGWEGNDCTLPQCSQTISTVYESNLTEPELGAFPATLLRSKANLYAATALEPATVLDGDLMVAWRKCPNNGNCTAPDTCTCEKGWEGADCKTPQCVQECFHGGRCTAPDTCTCEQWPTAFQDARGRPLFVRPDGDAQYTGWTGFDCNTPICVQAAKWVLNDNVGGGGTIELLSDSGKPLVNDGSVFQAGCSDNSVFITSLTVKRKSITLCRIDQWFLGSYEEAWANDDISSIPPNRAVLAVPGSTTSMYSRGRTIRVNYPNYIKTIDSAGLVTVSQGSEIPGEGLYACFNSGACVSPDVCQCMQNWGGYDCNVPQCTYTDVYSNAIFGCDHGGICYAVNLCSCPQVPSVLHVRFNNEPKDALTGWTAKDCTMAICVQGYPDSTCKNVPPGPGGVSSMGQGCYRCWNGGYCTAPDHCECAPGWQGYNCKQPVCIQAMTRKTLAEVNTIDDAVVSDFEYDPCGQNSLVPDGKGGMTSRGNCTRPNTCVCFCRQRAYKDSAGEWSESIMWTDPLYRPIPLGYVFGRYACVDGYEGNVNEDGTFSSCHLKIYVPSFIQRYSIQILAAGVSAGIAFMIISYLVRRQLRLRNMAMKTERRKERRLGAAEQKAFDLANKKKKST